MKLRSFMTLSTCSKQLNYVSFVFSHWSSNVTWLFCLMAGRDVRRIVRLADGWPRKLWAAVELWRRRLMTGILPSRVIKLVIGGRRMVSMYLAMTTPTTPLAYAMNGRVACGRSERAEHARKRMNVTKITTSALCLVSSVEKRLAQLTAIITPTMRKGCVM